MVLLSFVLLPLCMTHKGKLVRWEGMLLLIFYLGFSIWRMNLI